MVESQTGFVLGIISGVLGIIGSISSIVASYFFVPESVSSINWGLAIFGVWAFIAVVPIIIASRWMRNSEKCFKGGLLALIFGFLSANILALIAGILGVVAAKK